MILLYFVILELSHLLKKFEITKYLVEQELVKTILFYNFVDPIYDLSTWYEVFDHCKKYIHEDDIVTLGQIDTNKMRLNVPFQYWAVFVADHFEHYLLDDLRPKSFDNLYLCYNRKPTWHRVELYNKFDIVKNIFKHADDTLNFSISRLILEGPKDELDLTTNTQPAIFLISYSIFNLIKKEFNIDLNKAKYFAGHSLGEYSALSSGGYLSFAKTIKLLKARGDAMQNAVPKGEGGMVAVLGTSIKVIEKILNDNKDNFNVEIANDNCVGQIVLSGKNKDLDKLFLFLKSKNIRNIKLPVSAPFHCGLMSKATEVMKNELEKIEFDDSKIILISNVTANEIKNKDELKKLLIEQIEKRVRWRESIEYMIDKGVNHFIEVGPGKVLSGLVKRINKDVKINTINNENDIKDIKI